MKQCSRCKHIKDYEDFYKNKKSKDGLQSRCKSCVKECNKKYAQTEEFKNSVEKYHNSNKGYKSKREAQAKYERTRKGKATRKRYLTKTDS